MRGPMLGGPGGRLPSIPEGRMGCPGCCERWKKNWSPFFKLCRSLRVTHMWQAIDAIAGVHKSLNDAKMCARRQERNGRIGKERRMQKERKEISINKKQSRILQYVPFPG